jgi:hypothetical protein
MKTANFDTIVDLVEEMSDDEQMTLIDRNSENSPELKFGFKAKTR